MPKIEVGQAVLNHGTVDETWGICESTSVKDAADKKQIKNGQGDTKGIIYTDVRKEGTWEFTPLTGAGDPITKADLIGSRLTLKTEGVDTIEIVVDSAETKYKAGDVETWSVSGVYYPNLPAAT